MKILILGAGAVGGYFGARLIESGADVTFLVRKKRAQLLKKQGLKIISPCGDLNLKVKTITNDNITPVYDVILLTNKSYDMDEILETNFPVKNSSVIIPLLNGFSHIGKLEKKFSNASVFGGLAHIFSTIGATGEIQHFNEVHSITFGHLKNKNKDIGKNFYDICDKANFTVNYSNNIVLDLWYKWILIATVAGATTMFKCVLGEVLNTKFGKSFVEELHEECIQIAKSKNIKLDEKTIFQQRKFLTMKNSNWNSSMRRDMENGSKIEHDHIFFELIKIANRNKISCPNLKLVFTNGQIYSSKL